MEDTHEIVQGEGGKQGDPLKPSLQSGLCVLCSPEPKCIRKDESLAGQAHASRYGEELGGCLEELRSAAAHWWATVARFEDGDPSWSNLWC